MNSIASVQNIDVQEQHCLVALSMAEHVGPRTSMQLLQHFGSAKAVFSAKKKDLLRLSGLGDRILAALADKEAMTKAEKEIKFCERHGIHILSRFSPNYPKKLKEIHDAPILLYWRGDLGPPDIPHIAIVGTRRPTHQGKVIAAEFARKFAKLGIAVVSGLAYGIDIEAHGATVEAGGRTIAVLGHGLEQIYPRAHAKKALQILENGGALVSEFCSGTQPDAYNFPARNRIISGLSEAVLVVEAADKGGALITAKMAFEQDREVFAIPGNLNAPASKGCNRLIRDQVAKIALEPGDIIDSLQHLLMYKQDHAGTKRPKATIQLSDKEQIVVDSMIAGKEEFDDLCRGTRMDALGLRSVLLGLELRNVVLAKPGNKFALSI